MIHRAFVIALSFGTVTTCMNNRRERCYDNGGWIVEHDCYSGGGYYEINGVLTPITACVESCVRTDDK